MCKYVHISRNWLFYSHAISTTELICNMQYVFSTWFYYSVCILFFLFLPPPPLTFPLYFDLFILPSVLSNYSGFGSTIYNFQRLL